jgi:transcriptional regulator with XRE-family HTH domain
MSDTRLAERFGHNLWRCRRRAGLNQEALAELAELHRPEIGLYETGKRLPRLDTLLKLTAAADATPRELLAGLHWHPVATHVEDGQEWAKRSGSSFARSTSAGTALIRRARCPGYRPI